MNQEYRGKVARHLAAGGDPKYVNVKAKSQARRESSHEKALNKKIIPKHYRGNTNSEGGIPFGKKPKSAN